MTDAALHHASHVVANALLELAHAIRDASTGNTGNNAILQRLAQMEGKIMSAISEFATKQNTFNDRLDTAVSGITDDVAALKAEIEKLQNTSGTITPEDQALLDGIQSRTDAITAKLEALDALTPPTPPTA